MIPPTRSGTVKTAFRFSEVLSALSLVLDRVEGQPEGHTGRSCFTGMKVARRLGLTGECRSALFYALLLKDVRCSSNACRMSALFDADDFEVKRKVKRVDWTSRPRAALYYARTVSSGGSLWRKTERLLNFAVQGEEATRRLIQIRPYREALPKEKALEILTREGDQRGRQRALPDISGHAQRTGCGGSSLKRFSKDRLAERFEAPQNALRGP